MSKLANHISFCRALGALLAAVSFAAGGADVSYYGVIKSMQCLQTNDANAPAVLGSNGYSFTALAVASTNGVLTNATVKPGSGTLRALAPTTNSAYWLYAQPFNTQSALDSAYPVGTLSSKVNYTMTLSTVDDGVKTAELTFFFILSALTYPTPGQLTNLAAAQAIDTTADFTLGWKGLGGSALTIVELTIIDAASNVWFTTPAPLQRGALTGSSTSAVIPAYSLPPGANLIGHLTIANANPDLTSYSGATGVAALAVDTQFPLVTRPTPSAPRLDMLSLQAGKARLRLSGETNRIFQILASTNLATWTNVFTTNCQGGGFLFIDTNAPAHPGRFYRGKVGQ